MKKHLTIMICMGLLLVVTGCGKEVKEEKTKNKVLTCSYSHYNRDIIDEVRFIYDSEGKSFSKEAKDLSTLCSEHTDAPLKSCDAKLDGDTFTANMEIDVDKLVDKDQKNTPIDELKKQLENSSTESSVITCQIEEK